MTELTFIDLFSGIGGIRLAFESVGAKCIFSSEIDKFARKTYKANFLEEPFGDIRNINIPDIPNHDVLTAGFPCQPFSIAGISKKNSLKREHGFNDTNGGDLFFKIIDILKFHQPKSFLLENVKNLVYHNKGKTFKEVISLLNSVGYFVFYDIVNGNKYVPQNRERLFLIGFNKKFFSQPPNFSFDKKENKQIHAIKDILEQDVDSKYTLSNHFWKYLQDYSLKHKSKGNGFGYGLVDLSGITRTLCARYYKDGSEILIPQNDKPPRRLTPRECARLQGFPNNFIIPVSNKQAYKQFGNSVVVPLVTDLAKNIQKILIELPT